MIRNELERREAEKQMEYLRAELEKRDAGEHPEAVRGVMNALRMQLSDIEAELTEYERLKEGFPLSSKARVSTISASWS